MSIFQSLYCTNQHYKITYGNYNIHSIGLYSMPLQCIVGAYVMGLFYRIVNGQTVAYCYLALATNLYYGGL
ncbi:hypothetical protein LCGC14_2798850 [marine sediment metagenome]|uniref:Uncharacterized protein n=1 Tax=marine sediment metagenome TaxID=412755 RepID=A0A0F8YNC0_9ZZZZ